MKHVASYMLGFCLSLALTVVPVMAILMHGTAGLSPAAAYAALVTCALLQLWVQLYFFLHLGDEARPRWRGLSAIFAAVVVVILVGGTLWIMRNLGHGQHEVPFIGGVVAPETSND